MGYGEISSASNTCSIRLISVVLGLPEFLASRDYRPIVPQQ